MGGTLLHYLGRCNALHDRVGSRCLVPVISPRNAKLRRSRAMSCGHLPGVAAL